MLAQGLANPAVVGAQMLTVTGLSSISNQSSTSNMVQGEVVVEILGGSGPVHRQTSQVENGTYRLTMIDLSAVNPGLSSFNSQNQIKISIVDGSKPSWNTTMTRSLTVNEISSGLVEQDLEIVLTPEIGVASSLEMGSVYRGLLNQRQLEISNSGTADLEISPITSDLA